jgi:SAM-dependent methyltransferase
MRTDAFNSQADRYDAWYDTPKGQALLATEVTCLRPFIQRLPQPWLEVGVGTGRFAQALGIGYGLDPAPSALVKARQRGVPVVRSVGEAIPFIGGAFGGVLVAFSLCFVNDPLAVLREAHRVLLPDGGLVLGLLLRGTPWADFYAQRGKEGHPIYSTAHFYSKEEVERLLAQAGFRVTACRSTLFQPPGQDAYRQETPVEGYAPGCGFFACLSAKIARSH